MPTLEEIQRIYEEKLREDASFEVQGFRNHQVDYSNKLVESLTAYENYERTQLERARKDLEEIEKSLEYERFKLQEERNQSRKHSRTGGRVSTPTSRKIVAEIKKIEEKRAKLISEDLESFTSYYEMILEHDLENGTGGRLINVPYVLEARKRIEESLDAGIPVYLIGHLGSGKTQLAEEAAIDFAIRNRIQWDLETLMKSWFTNNPNASEEEAYEYFSEKLSERKKHYEELLVNGKKEEAEKLRPLFISGSHNLTYEDMFVEKTLKLSKGLSDKSYEEYMNRMISSFTTWLEKHQEDLEKLSEKEQLELKIQTWHTFSSLFLAGNSNFGTVVEKIDREILIAMKEGRPVIIDELNTIAMQNLIALNDILQRHQGQTAYVTGVGPVMIKPGFCLIGTGNMSSNTVNYEGTNQLNPAFKSRFTTIEYNYMPQNTKGSFADQLDPFENQLFRVIIEYLCDKKGRLTLPDPKEILEELFAFAQFARKTQNIFEGRDESQMAEATEDEEAGKDYIEPELNEAVLSIRNIIHVLEHWNYDEEEDLSTAIWKGFISSVTNPDDMNFLLALAVRYGFFQQTRGFSVRAKAKGQPRTTWNEIAKDIEPYYPGEYRTLSRLDVIHILFGKGPEYKEVPYELRDFIDGVKCSLSVDKYLELDKDLAHLEHSSDIWDYVIEKREDE